MRNPRPAIVAQSNNKNTVNKMAGGGYYFVNTSGQGTGAISGFLQGFQAMQNIRQKKKDSQVRENYYNSMIANAQARQALAEKNQAFREKQSQQSMGLRSQALNQSKTNADRNFEERQRHNKAMEGRNAVPDLDTTPANSLPDGPASRGANPTGAPTAGTMPRQTQPTQPWPGDRQSAVDTGGDVASNNDDDDTAQQTADADNGQLQQFATADDNDDDSGDDGQPQLASADTDGDTQFLDDGGPVGAVDADDNGNIGAVRGDNDQPQQQVTPASNAPGTSSSDGFNMGDALTRWKNGDPDRNPVHLGLMGIIDSYGLAPQSALPDAVESGAHENFRMAKGALTDREDHDLDRAVDPAHELNQAARNIKRLDSGVNWYLGGNPQGIVDERKARQYGAALLDRARLDTQKFGQYALQRLKSGDKAGTIDFLKRAYDEIPDGKSLDATIGQDGRIHAWTVDKTTGQREDLGAFDTPQVLRFVTGVANGQEFMRQMMAVGGGGRGQQQRPAAPEKIPSIEQRQKDQAAMQELTSAVDVDGSGVTPPPPPLDKNAPPGAKPPVQFPKQYADNLVNVATGIANANNIMPRDAARIAAALADPNHSYDGIKPTQDGGATMTLDDGRQIKLPRNAVLEAAAVRGKMLGKRGEWEEQAERAADRDLQRRGNIHAMQNLMHRAQERALERGPNTDITQQGPTWGDVGRGVVRVGQDIVDTFYSPKPERGRVLDDAAERRARLNSPMRRRAIEDLEQD